MWIIRKFITSAETWTGSWVVAFIGATTLILALRRVFAEAVGEACITG
jgi:hypothetical protein